MADVRGGTALEIIVADMGGNLVLVDHMGEVLWDRSLSGKRSCVLPRLVGPRSSYLLALAHLICLNRSSPAHANRGGRERRWCDGYCCGVGDGRLEPPVGSARRHRRDT